jgi:putative ABC transport system permease protein
VSEAAAGLRQAWRSLRRAPAILGAAVASLALGIGATVTVFAAVDATLRRAPPELAALARVTPLSEGGERAATLADVEAWRAAAPRVAFAAYAIDGVNVSAGSAQHAERLLAARVDAAWFDVVRADAALGRTFAVAERDAVALLSDGAWRRVFGGRGDVVGQHLLIDGKPATIIGVLPAEHRFPRTDVGIWLPLGRAPDVAVTVIARVERDAALASLRAVLAAVPGGSAGATAASQDVRVERVHETLLNERLRAAARIGYATVLIVLLIACANVANLLVARNVARRAELATRLALGAGRLRVARELLTDSFVIAALGGVSGSIVALAGTRLLDRLWAVVPDTRPFASSIAIDATVLLWALAATLLATLLAGVLPAWHAARLAPAGVLAEHARTATPARSAALLQSTLVGAGIALAFALLVSAGLLTRSFVALHASPLGFAIEDVLTFRIAPAGVADAAAARADELADRLRGLPAIVALGRGAELPLDGVGARTTYHLPAAAGDDRTWSAPLRRVDAGYHDALGIRLLEGRPFATNGAVQDPTAVLVNRRFAERHWAGSSALGETIILDDAPRTIVGVVADTREWGPHVEGPPMIYTLDGAAAAAGVWIVKAETGSHELAAAVRRITTDVLPGAAAYDVLPMRERLRINTARSELLMRVMAVFASIALLLAVGGVHAAVTEATSRRTRELAIRRALGATSARIARLVLRHGLRLAAAGVAAGAIIAFAVASLLRAFLPNIAPHDPLAFGAAAGLIGAAAMAASLLAAARAARVQPAAALREG